MFAPFKLFYYTVIPPVFWWIAGSVLVAVAVIASVIAFLRNGRLRSVINATFAAATVEYAFYIFCRTVIFRLGTGERRVELLPFRKYYDVFVAHDAESVYEMLMNIALFVPMGMLMAGCAIFFSKKRYWEVVLAGFLLSVIVELGQLVFACGLCETGDVINNTLGCALGAGIVFGSHRLLCSCRSFL